MKNAVLYVVAAMLASLVASAIADDTELYVGRTSSGGGRPKVLIILDNSGSMNTDVTSPKPSYDPSTTYDTQGSVASTRIYWSTDGKPPAATSDNYFLVNSNRCATSLAALNTTGTYTDYLAAWRSFKKSDGWRSVNDSDATRTSDYIDCKADVDKSDPGNAGSPAVADGYPLDGGAGAYTATVASSNVNWNNAGARTLFTANYMNWYHDASLAGPTKTRIDIAKEVVNGIIDSNPSVDFGLMVFNRNGTDQPSGGRVIKKINTNMTATDRSNLKTTVNNIVASTYTPLCETLYEAYRYYAGRAVYYGDDETSITPARDTSAESGGNYISPMGDCQQAYVILMTDGDPTNDLDANTLVDALPGIGSTSGSRLDELAGYLYRTDLDGDSSNGVQRVVTYTIGFTTAQQLLSDTATKGGGRYYTADNATQLTDSFQGALNEILSTDATFTSPSVAVNSFNRTRSLDDVYMAMFRPDSRPRWPGNLKKLRIDSNGALVDANGIAAIDPVTGNIKDTAQTLWSSTSDGGRVTEGGVGALLAARAPSTRVIKTNTGSNGALEEFALTNGNLTATTFGAASSTERDELIGWARGVDVDDENENGTSTDTRPWLIGDPLHSRPLVINYGARGTYTRSNPDVRIIMGTNAGMLHAFQAGDGSEAWAFIPKEMGPLVKILRDNTTSTTHPYGIDGTAVAYMEDTNHDGTISGSEKVYLFFGLRRGGNAYYALDISDPDNPSFLWRIDDSSTGLSELGQSWATPVVTRVPGYTGLVLIFSGGYDSNKDASGVGTADSQGRGIFIVDALTGHLVWSVTPAANSATNLQATDLVHSIPAAISALDSNGDGHSDRLYAADTGGNVWRVDLAGSSLPTAAQTTWSIFKLASFGGNTTSTDRRFFNKPDVVRARTGGLAYDALALGSGNRSHPNETAVSNRFYLIRDTEIMTSYHGSGGTTVPTPLTESNLYDATANLIQDGNATQQSAALTDLSNKRGWFVSLERSGEKSLSQSLTLSGTVFFTTFAPDANAISCVPVPGNGYLYAISLQNGSAAYEWDPATPTSLTKADRDVDVGHRLPDSVTPHFGPDTIRVIGVGAGDNGSGSYDTKTQLTTQGAFWHEAEN
jgi:type IV pilus assembly protein PilY1